MSNARIDVLRRLLEALPDRECDVLFLRYGLGGGEPMTLEEVGMRLDLSREAVREIEFQALHRLRPPGGLPPRFEPDDGPEAA